MKIYAVAELNMLPSTLPPICRVEGAKSQKMSVLIDTGRTCKNTDDFLRVIRSQEFEGGTYIPVQEKVEPRTVVLVPSFNLEPVKKAAINENPPTS